MSKAHQRQMADRLRSSADLLDRVADKIVANDRYEHFEWETLQKVNSDVVEAIIYLATRDNRHFKVDKH